MIRIDWVCWWCIWVLFVLLMCDVVLEIVVSVDWGLLEMRGDKSENKSDDGVWWDILFVLDDVD